MWLYITKVAVTSVVVVAVAEIGKRNSAWAAAIASLPLTSLLAFVWLYVETGDAARVSALAASIFWLVLPSLALFVLLPLLLRSGMTFWPSLAVAIAGTLGAYAVTVRTLASFGVRL
jgi:hypothetical protein